MVQIYSKKRRGRVPDDKFYRPRDSDPLRRLFSRRFPAFQAVYEQRYAYAFGGFHLPLITRGASAFRLCGDWSQGIARIHCPDCGYDIFRPFSCKSFTLYPSCARKRTLLLGEYLCDALLLRLPQRQFVWTIPRVFRGFLRRHRELFADLGRLLCGLLCRYFCPAAGRKIRTATVSSHQTFGEFARTLLSWRHSGFSIDSDTRIYNTEARQGLDSIAQVTLHIPPQGKHLLRRHGLYACSARGTWKKRPALSSRAPLG